MTRPVKHGSLRELLSKFDIKLSINAGFLNAEITFTEGDQKAAWELYIELLTRITTQPLPADHGLEKAALDSVYSIFPITRNILKKYGKGTTSFSKIAIPILNQKIRPFTAKWHKLSAEKAFDSEKGRRQFREELAGLQEVLKNYNRLLAELAGVEDLTDLENNG